jgi:hypothetical protein
MTTRDEAYAIAHADGDLLADIFEHDGNDMGAASVRRLAAALRELADWKQADAAALLHAIDEVERLKAELAKLREERDGLVETVQALTSNAWIAGASLYRL